MESGRAAAFIDHQQVFGIKLVHQLHRLRGNDELVLLRGRAAEGLAAELKTASLA